MAANTDYSLHCCVDSDLPGAAMPAREPNDNTPADAGSHRAQLGFLLFFAGGVLEASSRRQHATAVDVTAAELYAASVAGAVLTHIIGVHTFASFGVLGRAPVRVWCDNRAAVMVANDSTSIKRLAYIARRVRFLQELVARSVLSVLSVPGSANPADAMTKHLSPKAIFLEYMGRAYNCATAALRAPPRTEIV